MDILETKGCDRAGVESGVECVEISKHPNRGSGSLMLDTEFGRNMGWGPVSGCCAI